MNGGFSTGYFAISRGVRQGDPLSPYLFILCLEALLSHIRLNKDIKGIPVEMVEIKLSAFADDLTLFLKDVASARRTFTLIEEFSILSGLKMNKSKCEALWLGSNKDREDFPLDIRWVKTVKILGISFSYNEAEVLSQNFTKTLKAMKDLSSLWSRRHLSLLKKITFNLCSLNLIT